ncbi:hypothetical protein JCM8547_002095 [Rhodosporidiobolus lusitaniae]
MGALAVDHLLAHHLDSNERVPTQLAYVLAAISSLRSIHQLEHEEGQHGPTMHRWQLRLTFLIASSQPPAVRAAGFQLLHATYSSSTTVLLATGKTALQAAQSVLSSPKTDSDLFCSALECVKLLLAKSTYHPEWARENVGAQTVQKVVTVLVQAASNEGSEVVLPVVSAIVPLLPLYPTALRPLSPSLHTLAINLISPPVSTPSTVNAGAHLFVSLYLLAPKGKDGLKEAWKTGVEALIGSIDALATEITQRIFSEDILFNHTLSPLSLPPLPDPTPHSLLSRLESLSTVLLLTLRTPTTERAGPVPIPVPSLVELSLRLLSFTSAAPVAERTDPSVLTAVLALSPRLQLVGARLAAQLALTLGGSTLALHASTILSTLARTLGTYVPRSPMRPALSGAFSIVLQALGGSVDPEEGKKSLARVWRTVLEDIGAVALEPVVSSGEKGGKEGGGNGRRAKRQRMYDPSESMERRRVSVGEVDLEIAERGLETLERLLLTPHASFLPPSLQLSTSRLLLFLSLSPTFFQNHPLASTSTASFFPATAAGAGGGLDIAKQSARFRRGVVKALRASVEAGVGAEGTIERAAEAWRRGVLDHDEEITSTSHSALLTLHRTIHPLLPPQTPNSSLTRQVSEARGGQFVGDEVDYRETAEEFRLKVQVNGGAAEEDEGDEEDEEGEGEGGMQLDGHEPVRKTPAVAAPAQAAPVAPTPPPAPAFTPAPPASGFAAFAAPSFGSVVPPPSVPSAAPIATTSLPSPVPSTVPEPTLDVEVVRSTTTTKKEEVVVVAQPVKGVAGGGVDGEDSDSDDEMPAIVMGSDEE